MDRFEKQKQIVSKLNIMDDTLFHKMAEDMGVCEEIICTILEDDKIKVVSNVPQKYLRNTGARSVILDVLCKDADGRMINIEVQKADDDNHQKRVRYNGSNIDTYMTEKGVKYSEIPDVYIIFISKFDIFGENRTVYHIERRIKETGKIVDNGFHEIYVNAKIDDGSRTAELMQYMSHTVGKKENFPRTSDRAYYFKEEQEGVNAMCEVVEKYAEERAREAAKKAAREAAKKAAREAAIEVANAKKEAKEAAKEAESMAARKFFLNGANYKMVRESMQYLTNVELDAIYEDVKSVKA